MGPRQAWESNKRAEKRELQSEASKGRSEQDGKNQESQFQGSFKEKEVTMMSPLWIKVEGELPWERIPN